MNRRIKALEVLQRVEERALTQISQRLCAAQGARAAAVARHDALGQRAVVEGHCDSPEALPYIGRFLATLRKEQAREAHIAAELDEQIEGLQGEVMRRFTAEKTYSQLADTQKQAIKLSRLQQSEAQLEDITASRFGR